MLHQNLMKQQYTNQIPKFSVENQMFVLLSVTDRRDDQRSRVFTTIIRTWTKEWVEFLSEAAASKGVDKSCSINVIKGDQTLLIIHKHPHLLRLMLQRETDCRASTSIVLIFIPQPYRPITILRRCCDLSLPVDRLSGHS